MGLNRCSNLMLFILLAVIIGCSSGGNQTTPVTPGNPDLTGVSESAQPTENSHALLLYNLINIDATNPEDVKTEIIPARIGSMHLNILKLLEYAPCTDCFEITGVYVPEPGKIFVDIQITHPFDDLNLTVFDVRGIMMFNGSHVFPASGLTISDSSMGDGELLNAEGYTTLYNGSTFGEAGDLFTYFPGNLSTPTIPDSELNGFLRYIAPENPRNALYPEYYVKQTYFLKMPTSGMFSLGYAVDANWWPPIDTPVDNPMIDFDLNANCPEPWKITVTEMGPGLTDEGGQTVLSIDVYDYEGKDTLVPPNVECPELFNGVIEATWSYDDSGYSHYEATINNTNLASQGDYWCLISVEANENASSPDYLDLTAYQVITLTVSDAGGVVIFPDPVLEQKIREAINKPVGEIYKEDLLGLTVLDASSNLYDPKITNIEGLQFCINMETLDLRWNYPLSDITPLQNLTALTWLDLCTNHLSDISPLQNLTALTYLDLRENNISDITPLQNLTGLIDLWLETNQISDITPLQNLTALTSLGLQWNQISVITPLQNLTELENLSLSENSISNITPLQNLTALTRLMLDWNHISDITPLQNLTELEYLWLGVNSISDITPLQNLTALIELDIAGNQISDIMPLQNLIAFSVLWLDGNQISDIYPLVLNSYNGGLGSGDQVSLEYNPLSDESKDVYIPQLQANGVVVIW